MMVASVAYAVQFEEYRDRDQVNRAALTNLILAFAVATPVSGAVDWPPQVLGSDDGHAATLERREHSDGLDSGENRFVR